MSEHKHQWSYSSTRLTRICDLPDCGEVQERIVEWWDVLAREDWLLK